ncbi:hypothetical protein [Caballeronia sp. GAWG2-1]|uniref:hypothetical protein n=1 Tax=Caballeronia sp. GAWG2-1 TaxID=2921744 RepID=UPI0020283107|nr:hypothetical protein [Caballeronia sp. GAWG2-1]
MMRGNRAMILAFMLIVFGLIGIKPARAEQTVNATVEQPRAFGHVLGDVLTQRVLLSTDGHDVALPSAGRVGVWFERRASRIVKDTQGRSWLVLEYQITNAAQALTNIELPALELRPAAGAVLRVPAWPISVGPLTPRASFRAGDLQALRPDRLVIPVDDPAVHRRMIVMLALLLVTLASWVAWWWWSSRRYARQRPFARAWRHIRTDADANDDAWVHVHRALDETAGQVVHAASLPTLFVRAPYLQSMKPRLEEFYTRSQERFFVRDAAPAPFDLRDFARALYRAERGQ